MSECGYRTKSISKLLADAIYYAEHGFPVSTLQAANLKAVKNEGWLSCDLKKVFLPNGTMPNAGDIFCQKKTCKNIETLS